MRKLKLSILSGTYMVCRLDPNDEIPAWIDKSKFWTVTKTDDELSIVCAQTKIPSEIKSETGFKMIKVEGPLDFSWTGILSSIANPLAAEKISIVAISTFDTDYVLVREEKL